MGSYIWREKSEMRSGDNYAKAEKFTLTNKL